MKNKNNFKNMNPYLALTIALWAFLASSYFSVKTMPVFLEVEVLLNKGTAIDFTGVIVLAILLMISVFISLSTILYLAAQKRVIDVLHGQS